MAQIKLELSGRLIDGMDIKFKAPCDCTAVTGLLVSYINDAGEAAEKSFTFRDSHGNNLAGLGNLFGAGAYVKAILNTGNGYAYLQNADTNAYLESKLTQYSPVVQITSTPYILSAADVGRTLVVSYDLRDVDVVVKLSQSVSQHLQPGFDVGFYWHFGKSFTIECDNIAVATEDSATSTGVDVNITIPEKYGSIAMKKMYNNGTSDFWRIYGDVEVEVVS